MLHDRFDRKGCYSVLLTSKEKEPFPTIYQNYLTELQKTKQKQKYTLTKRHFGHREERGRCPLSFSRNILNSTQ